MDLLINKSNVKDIIDKANDIVVLTGAGISAESGIPTFRGNGGAWNSVSVEKFATLEGFLSDPEVVWEWYEDRREEMCSKEPNPAHIALAELENTKNVIIITQNIDDLHERAGSTNVIKIHGNISKAQCRSCKNLDLLPVTRLSVPPTCSFCGGEMRPNVVWFGEDLPMKESTDSIDSIYNHADLLLVVGTSNMVSTSTSYMQLANQCNVPIIVVNPNNDHNAMLVDHHIKDKAGIALPKLLKS